MPIIHEEGAVTQRAVPGPALYHVSTMPPEGTPLAAMIGVLHGYADHSARYAHVMDSWAEQGIGSVAIDMRGHGRATGKRGFCTRFDEYLDDAAELARLVGDRARGAPCFLFGHSFGGLVASLSVTESPRSWRGLILSAPFFGFKIHVPPIKEALGRVASRLYPALGIPSGLSGKDVTHDVARAKAYDQDPLVFHNATARWFTETTMAQPRNLSCAPTLKMPLYLVFGGADPIADVASGKEFFDVAGSKDKTWQLEEGLYHEVLNEPEWPRIAGAIASWTLAHAKASAAV